jgi:hypothetical protein
VSQLPAGQGRPVDLDYPEPGFRSLDLGSILVRGRRIRRRRRLAHAAAALVASAAIASAVAGARGHAIGLFQPPPAGPPAGQPAAPIDALVASHPPANGQLTLISSWPRHWTTLAWATRDGSVCWATYRVPMSGGTEQFECPAWSPADVPGAGTRALSPLFPGIFPDAPDGRLVPELGLATPRASRVTVTFAGKDFSATVVPVPLPGGKTVGVFITWIRLPAHQDSYGSSQVTREIAYDRGGRIIARHGPWP